MIPSNINVTIEVSKLSFLKPVFDLDHLAGLSRRRSMVCVVQKPACPMKHLIGIFSSHDETAPDFCMRIRSIFKARLLSPKYSKCFMREAKHFCLSKVILYVLGFLARKVLNVDFTFNEPNEILGAARTQLF